MRKATASIPLSAVRRRGRRRPGTGVADPATWAETLVELGPVGGARRWFARGQLRPAPDVEEARGTGARC
jgi:hypothetical protein